MRTAQKEPKITMTIEVYSDGSTRIIPAENITESESEIRDVDMAAE